MSDNKEIKIIQDWANYFCLVEDITAIINLNLGFKETGVIPNYKFNILFNLKILNPTEDGLVTNEELERLYQIEDAILDNLEKKGFIFVGNLKTNGVFTIYFYSKSTEDYKEVIDSIMKTYSEYEYFVDFAEDPTWDSYFNFLYPNKYEYQSMMNMRTITNLLNAGDNLELEREVEHWFYFKSTKNREFFAKEITKLGYEVISQDNLESVEYPHQLYVTHNNNILLDNMNDCVWELIELVEKYEGIYDGWASSVVKRDI